MPSPSNNLKERLSALEHDRWARWQNYLHSFLKWNGTAWELPIEQKDRWQRQIETPYNQLTEAEKDSDRKEVTPGLNLILDTILESPEMQEEPDESTANIKISPYYRNKLRADLRTMLEGMR